MINIIQIAMYKLGVLSFYIMVGLFSFTFKNIDSIDKYVTTKNIVFCTILLLVIVYHYFFVFVYVNKRLPKIKVNFGKTPEEKDDLLKMTLLSSVFAAIPQLFSAEDIVSIDWCVILSVVAMLFIVFWSNKIVATPWGVVLLRHFHTVETKGGKKIILMSRIKTYRNRKQVRNVYRLFDNFVIDAD